MRLYQRNGTWWADAREHGGGRFSLKLTDRASATVAAADWLRGHERERTGIKPAPAEALSVVIDRRCTGLLAKGRDPDYVAKMRTGLEAAAESMKWRKLADIGPDELEEFAAGLENAPATIEKRLSYLRGLFTWAMRKRITDRNPFDQADLPEPGESPKTRRALSPEEIGRLLGSSPHDRRLVYRVLTYTGLRRKEARKLEWSMVHLFEAPRLELPAAVTKSRQAESIPLIPRVVADLSRLKLRASTGPVFESIPSADTFNRDLERAKIPKVIDGKVVVLHSLRHSLDTMLLAAGVPGTLVMKIMRHRDATLSLRTYSTDALLPLRQELGKIEVLGG